MVEMKKKYIHIYQCKSGDILADNVYDDCGILIVAKDDVINEHVIKRLKTFRIRQLSVYDLPNSENEQNFENVKNVKNSQSAESAESTENVAKAEIGESTLDEFKKDYLKDISVMKQVLGDIAAGRKLDYEKTEWISNSIYSKINSISNVVECMNGVKKMDEYTYAHSINVAMYALLIAKWLDLSEEETRNVVTTGILHDIGKSRISGDILNKKGPLLPEEYEQMKHHPEIGYRLSKDIPQLTDEIRGGILMHHEREDGKGYPSGIKGANKSLYAKIISVADVYDALTSERAYKKRITPFDTFRELISIGYGYFDTKVLMTFLSNISCYYNGTIVKMNTGEMGKVIFVAPHSISMPTVSVNGNYIDLSQNRQLQIVEMM